MANTIGVEAIVEIDENERYWVGKGFGKGGLLPTDRGPFTTPDGSISWKSAEEATEDLLMLGRGWVYYKAGDEFKTTQEDNPESCWLYASDFRPESIANATPNKGALHWVRFRRLVRIKLFTPDEFVPREVYDKCDHCDSVHVDALSKQLLDVLAYTSLLHSQTNAADSTILALKQSVVDLAIGHQVAPNEESDVFAQLSFLRKKLENYVEQERSQTIMNRLLSGVEFSYYGRHKEKEFAERCEVVSARCLPKSERDAIAGLIVRNLDRQFQVHCNKAACGSECQFARVECPNEGCSATMSKSHLQLHDSTCPYKMIECECGERFLAQDWPTHLTEACKLRTVECPFSGIGCNKAIKACDIENHVAEDIASHLVMAVNQVVDNQKSMKELQARVAALETENKGLKQAMQQHRQTSDKVISDVQSKLASTSNSVGKLESTCKKEIKNLKAPKRQLT